MRAPATVVAGQQWTAQVTVTRGGVRVRGLVVRIRARRGAEEVSARAAPVARGVYRARLRFSGGGHWGFAVLVARRSLARGSVVVTAPKPPPPTPTAPPSPALPPCTVASSASAAGTFQEWNVATPARVHPHDLWPAGDGTVWYTGQFKARWDG